MYFLRQKKIKLSIGKEVYVREFTFRNELIFHNLQNTQDRLLFILNNSLLPEEINSLSAPDKEAILSSSIEVNSEIKREPIKGKKIALTVDEHIDYLCRRWGILPLDLIERLSREMIITWNSICRKHDDKIYSSVQGDPASEIEAAKNDPEYIALKQKRPVKNLSLEEFQLIRRGVK